ncbi:protein FAM13A-like isoform X3 [Pieris brassicae]|uniref:protein FAM13A-like isoform X3 n=1 Tax=Pieris brassicae TaxID=7116 RepID=UPI001E65E9E8|nr:protein FAM13A-like isoform X3 [Pieris brassicae]
MGTRNTFRPVTFGNWGFSFEGRLSKMVLLEIQGFGQASDRSSDRRIVISNGWRAQCCEQDHEGREREDMAAPECEREARKRRERRDSGCAHERKERRPHSEERLPPPPPPPPLHDYNRLESERRAERLSRARRPQFGKRRRAPRLPRQPKENDRPDDTRSETPPHFEYVVQQKPELYEEILPASQTQTYYCEEPGFSRRDERSVPPRRTQASPDRRLEKINKKITVLKKTIFKYENDFETQNGRAISPGERMTDVQYNRMLESLRRLQAEKRCIKSDPVEYALKVQAAKLQKERDEKLDAALRSDKPMGDIVRDIEEWIEGCRQAAGRAAIPESSWTSAQLAAEKACVQRALLRLEAARGRPAANTAERGAARHLYERYRAVKRNLQTRSDNMGTNGELATIHEHETMLFTSVDSSSDSQEKPSDSSQETTETPLQSPPSRDIMEEMPSSTSSAKSATSEETPSNEGLHFLGLEDLARALSEAKMQKCVLRRTIKEYEFNFEVQNSRKVQRDDKKGREEEYQRYKAIKLNSFIYSP